MLLLGVAVDSISAFSDETSAVCERADGAGVLIHEIDLLEGQAFGLEEITRSDKVERHMMSMFTSGMQK